jgi:ADP-heptose:LPS heptosyltransferase
MVTETTPAIAAEQFSGGSQAITFYGGWLALTHEAHERAGKRFYQHRFVWFDEASTLRHVSGPFFFHKSGIEFAAGLAWHPDGKRLLISYGASDSESWIATVDAAEVQRVLQDLEWRPPSASGSSAAAEQRHDVTPRAAIMNGDSTEQDGDAIVVVMESTDGGASVQHSRKETDQSHEVPLTHLVRAPLKRTVIDIVRNGGLGDVLMCTPGLRALKHANPEGRINFYTYWRDVVDGLPYIDKVLPTDAAPAHAIRLGYEHAIPPYAHISCVLADNLGVWVQDVRPDCVIQSKLVLQFRQAWEKLPRPHIIVSRHASGWSPNKNWPDAYWEDLIDRLTRFSTVIEIGAPGEIASRTRDRNYIDLVGRTSVNELVAVVAAADLHIGPVSAPVHIAAATRKTSVVICGGYEHPRSTLYSGNVALYTPLDCAPCWLREPCPYNRKCLDAISPQAVEQEVRRVWSRVGAAAPHYGDRACSRTTESKQTEPP